MRLGLTLSTVLGLMVVLVLLAVAGPSNTPGIFGVSGAIVSQGTTRAPIGGPGWVLVTKSGNTAITNSTVAVPDPDLCIVLATDSSYEIRARIIYGGNAIGTTPGFRFMGTAAPTGHAGFLLIDALTGFAPSIQATFSPCLLPCTTGVVMETYGDVGSDTTAISRVVLGQLRGPRSPTSGGTWCLAWANQIAGAGKTTTVIAGSTLSYRQITP